MTGMITLSDGGQDYIEFDIVDNVIQAVRPALLAGWKGTRLLNKTFSIGGSLIVDLQWDTYDLPLKYPIVKIDKAEWKFVDHSCPIPGGGTQDWLTITKIEGKKKVVQKMAPKWWHIYGTIDCKEKCGLGEYGCPKGLDWTCKEWNAGYVKCGDWECMQNSCGPGNYGCCMCITGLDYYEL